MEEAEQRRREENNRRFGFDSDYLDEPSQVEEKVCKKKTKVVPRIPPKKVILSSEELELLKLKPSFKARPLPSKILE